MDHSDPFGRTGHQTESEKVAGEEHMPNLATFLHLV